jgi:hypothetical protein
MWLEKNQKLIDASLQAAQQLATTFDAVSERRLAQIEKEREARLDALNTETELELGIYSESEKDRAIIEERYRQQALVAEEVYAAKEKEIRKRQADIQLAIIVAQTIAGAAKSAAESAGNPFILALVGITAAAAIAAATAQRNEIAKLAYGGILSGPSHANGGIYMGGGVEAEGGEAVINKRSTRMFGGMLSAINQAGGGAPFVPGESLKGGISSPSATIIDYDRLAAAVANNPVRAFVVTQDISLAQNQQTAIQSKATIA